MDLSSPPRRPIRFWSIDQVADDRQQHADDDKIDGPSRDLVHLFGAFSQRLCLDQTGRRDVEQPAEQQHDGETDQGQTYHDGQRPLRHMQGREHDRSDLDDQPGDHRIGRGDAENPPSSQVGEGPCKGRV